MNECFVSSVEIQQFLLWDKLKEKRVPLAFDLEVTARCNLDCRHCCINLPAGDRAARAQELSLAEISRIADEALSLGAMWCLITGGEPLLRDDFRELYLALKRKGLLLSVFTNATLINEEHIRLFKRYPPRDIEVSVYGVTRETYEQVTQRRGSFAAFMRGLDRLFACGVKVRLKAMALRSNLQELPAIARFCRERTKDFFRFDPLLHLRFDGNARRNAEICAERLSPETIVAIERADEERFAWLVKACDKLIVSEFEHTGCGHLFHCGAGNGSFSVSYDGFLRLCSDLWHPDCVYNLRNGTLADAWHNLVPKVRDLRSDRKEFLETCRMCPIVNFCFWCPALAHLETGELDGAVPYFCKVAHARAAAIAEIAGPSRQQASVAR
jgi:radical SAM protein with 4Fe4S-binding SPASM domain